jgi:hypothetical protein
VERKTSHDHGLSTSIFPPNSRPSTCHTNLFQICKRTYFVNQIVSNALSSCNEYVWYVSLRISTELDTLYVAEPQFARKMRFHKPGWLHRSYRICIQICTRACPFAQAHPPYTMNALSNANTAALRTCGYERLRVIACAIRIICNQSCSRVVQLGLSGRTYFSHTILRDKNPGRTIWVRYRTCVSYKAKYDDTWLPLQWRLRGDCTSSEPAAASSPSTKHACNINKYTYTHTHGYIAYAAYTKYTL